MRGCGPDYSDKEIVNIDGEDFELIKQETDTVFVEKEVQGDSIAYWLWWDHEETALYQKLNLLLASINDYDANNQKDNSKKNIWSFAKKLYSQNAQNTSLEDIASVINQRQTPYLKNWSSVIIEIPSPPPKS